MCVYLCDGKGKEGPYLPIDILRRGFDIARLAVDAAVVRSVSSGATARSLVYMCIHVYRTWPVQDRPRKKEI